MNTTRLGDLADLRAGFGFPKLYQGRSTGDLPFAKVGDISRVGRSDSNVLITAGHFIDEADLKALKARAVPTGSTLFAKIGEAIRQEHRVMAGRPLVIDNNAMAAVPKPGVDPRYLFRFLQTLNMYSMTSSTTVPALRKSDLERVSAPLRDIGEQRRIVGILDKADELRTKRRQAIAHLDALTQSIFHSMFGDPDPEKDGQPLRSLVPQGDGINYGVIQPGADVAGGKPLIRVSDLALGGVRLTHLKAIAPEIEAQYRRSRLKGTEILVSCVGTIGEIATTNSDVIGFNIARAVARVPIDRPSLRLYVAEYLRTARVKRYFTKELRTVSQPTLNIKQLGDTLVIVPPEDQQDLFAERVSAIEPLKNHHREQLDELDALFASLQNQAFKAEF